MITMHDSHHRDDQFIANKTEHLLNELSDYYLNTYRFERSERVYSLHSGHAGAVFMSALLFQGTKDQRFKIFLEAGLEFIIDRIDHPSLYPTFCSGIAGFGWLLNFLVKNNLVDVEASDFFEDLDEKLKISLDEMLAKGNIDLLHGALGLGVYFLMRNDKVSVERIVSALDTMKSETSRGIAWVRNDSYFGKEKMFDLGLAHGNASILYFLSKVYESNIVPNLVKDLLQGNIAFFLNNIQDIEQSGSFFPNYVTVRDVENDVVNPSLSRIGWCYGDLGILYTIFRTAQRLSDEHLQKKSLDMLKITAGRRAVQNTMITDAGVCHGTAGNALMFKNLFTFTGISEFSEASEFWLSETITFSKEDSNGAGGFQFYLGERGRLPQTELLNGSAGIASVLADFLYDIDSKWTESFFLD